MRPDLTESVGRALALPRERFGDLLERLADEGYRVLGPTVHAAAIVYGEIRGVGDLPAGWTDDQEAGRYRLRRRGDGALFGYTLGPHTWRRTLLPPRETLLRARRQSPGRFQMEAEAPPPTRLALLGPRACELAAMAIQDRVLQHGPCPDAHYAARRRGVFVIAVQCTQAAPTCFCASMGTGPRAREGFDLGLTELCDEGGHRFVVEIGTEAGAELIMPLDLAEASRADRDAALALSAAAALGMGRHLETEGLPEVLFARLDSPRWEAVARRCLACGNCTLCCPTCFCSTVEDRTDLAGAEAVRERRWDSCFAREFSHLHGGCVRGSIAARYRQWLTHKLGGWVAQFGTSGCVGCGRCITWCPAGIDLTEEVAALRVAAASASPPATPT